MRGAHRESKTYNELSILLLSRKRAKNVTAQLQLSELLVPGGGETVRIWRTDVRGKSALYETAARPVHISN